MDNCGTFGWTISTSKNLTLYEGSGPVEGPREVANSTRCELAGLVAPLLLLNLLARQWGTRFRGKFRWVCDSQAAILNVERHTNMGHIGRGQPPNADLLVQIRASKVELGSRIRPKWIKGHQSPQTSLKKDVIRNNKADELATAHRANKSKRQSREQTDHLPDERVSIRINGVKQVSQIEACIRFHINGYHMRQYLQERYRWSDGVWDTIDLKMLGQFCRALPSSSHTAQVKFMHQQRHTGVQRYRISRIKDPKLKLCPCCQLEDETNDHVLTCEANPGREKALRQLRKAIDLASVLPAVKLFKTSILGWLEGQTPDMDSATFPSHQQDLILTAMEQQSSIGWSAALRGFLSVTWCQVASWPFGDNEKPNRAKGEQTMRKFLMALHTYSMSIWKERNTYLHGEASTRLRELRCPELIEITYLHSHPEWVNAGDRHFCERPLDDLLRAGHSVRRRWLIYTRNARARYGSDGRKQTVITDFFRTS